MTTQNRALIPSELLREAQEQLQRSYAAQGYQELSEAKIEVLARDTVAHAVHLARIAHRKFLKIPSLPESRYDEDTRRDVHERSVANHRKTLLEIFVTRSVSSDTSAAIVGHIMATRLELI